MPTLCNVRGSDILLSEHPEKNNIYLNPVSGSSLVIEFANLVSAAHKVDYAPENFIKLAAAINLDQSKVYDVMPAHILKDFLLSTSEICKNVFRDEKNKDYFSLYLEIKSFLKNLKAPIINKHMVESLIKESKHDGPKYSFKSFIDSGSIYSPPVYYSQDSTLTGRLTVKKGPNILTAPSSIRNCFKSRFKNGKILQLDLISAEPKFALLAKQGFSPEDVYSDLCSSIFEDKLTRKQAKLTTLCSLYGQSKRKLAEKLPPDISPTDIVNKTNRYFGKEVLLDNIKSTLKKGQILNYFGRPLTIPENKDHILISYFLQSSVAEASIKMFSDYYNENKDSFVPLYVIHDALIIDATPEFFTSHKESMQVDLFLNNWKFETEIKVLGNN